MLLLSILRRLLDAGSTILLVTAIAVMVWLFAEQQNVHDQPALSVDLVYGTPEEQKNFLVFTPADAPKKITITFRCSNTQVDAVKKKLLDNGPYPLHLGLNSKAAGTNPVSFSVNLKEKIQQALADDRLPVSNIKVEPDTSVTLIGEKMEEVTVPVDFHLDERQLRLTEPPKKSEDSVRVMLPASLIGSWGKNIKSELNLNKLVFGPDIKPGEEISRQVPVEIPFITEYLKVKTISAAHKAYFAHPAITPASVNVTLKLEKISSKEFKLDTLPVTIVPLPGSENKWSFEFTDQNDKYLNDLRLTGSPEDTDRILNNMKNENETKLVWAVARVTNKIPADGKLMLDVEVLMPPGVNLAPGTLLKKIEVRATRRNSP